MWDKRAEYLSNPDGNSVKMILDQGFGDTKLVTLRLLGVYAPTLEEKGGKECKTFISDWFARHDTGSDTRWGFEVETVQMDTDRFVAVVVDAANTSCLNGELAEFIYNNAYTVVKKAV